MILGNILERVRRCKTYREFIYSDDNCQHVAMMLQPSEEIPKDDPEPYEIHKVTQFFMVVEGEMTATYRLTSGEVHQTVVRNGDCIIIPPGVYHNIINSNTEITRIYTIYTPRQHY